MIENGRKSFAEYTEFQGYSQKNLYRKIVRALLIYKYSPLVFWSAALKYGKVMDAMAALTVEQITGKHFQYNVCAIIDPHAINKTVAKLRKNGYRITKTEYIPFIELSTTK
jgi:hypothetical protein